MSRTFRNRPFQIVSGVEDAIYWLSNDNKTEAEVIKMIYQHYLDSHSGAYNTAKKIRRVVEKTRRARNKQEVYRAVNQPDYEPDVRRGCSKDNQIQHYS